MTHAAIPVLVAIFAPVDPMEAMLMNVTLLAFLSLGSGVAVFVVIGALITRRQPPNRRRR